MSERRFPRVTNRWVTPVAGGLFLLIAGTGISLFFHANTIIGHVVHEWLGWLLVAVVVLHLVANSGPLAVHLKRPKVRWTVAVFAALLLVAVVPFGDSVSPESAMRSTMMRVASAPIHQLAPLAGRDAETIVADLRAAGFTSATTASTCRELAGSKRPDLFRAISIVFPMAERR